MQAEDTAGMRHEKRVMGSGGEGYRLTGSWADPAATDKAPLPREISVVLEM